MLNKMILVAAFFIGSSALAGECVLSITRTACPGQEKESYKKCEGGKASCEEVLEVAKAEACADKAVDACQNKRYDITKYKVIKASFNGKELEGGKDFCSVAVAGKYDPKKDFPYKDKADCK